MSGTLPRRWGSWLLVVLQRPTSAPSLPLAPVEVELEVVQPPLAWLVVRAEQEVQRGPVRFGAVLSVRQDIEILSSGGGAYFGERDRRFR